MRPPRRPRSSTPCASRSCGHSSPTPPTSRSATACGCPCPGRSRRTPGPGRPAAPYAGSVGRRGALWVVGLLAVLGATPGGRSFVKSTVMLAEVLPSLARRGLGRRGLGRRGLGRRAPAVRRIELAHGKADLFETPDGHRRGAPGVVLVHGANRDGIDDPRVQALA